MDVPLRHVVQLPDRQVADGIALLLRRVVEDAERPDERLLQDVRRGQTAEQAEVTGAAQAAVALELERVRRYRHAVLAELGQVQNVLLGPLLLVVALELVERELVQRDRVGLQPPPVDLLQLQTEVAKLGGQVS